MVSDSVLLWVVWVCMFLVLIVELLILISALFFCCLLFLLLLQRSEKESLELIGCRYGKDFEQVEGGKTIIRIYYIRKLQLKLKAEQQCLVLIWHVMWGMNVRFDISFDLRKEKVPCCFFWKFFHHPFRVWNRSQIRV